MPRDFLIDFSFTPTAQNTLGGHQKSFQSVFLQSSSTPVNAPSYENSLWQAPTVSMVGKKSGKALLREEGNIFPSGDYAIKAYTSAGLARTDNGMKQTSWPEVPMINQKNYYTYVLTFKCEFFYT